MSTWKELLGALAAGAVAGLPYLALGAPSILAPLCLVPLARIAGRYAQPGRSGAATWVAGYLAAIGQSFVAFFWLPRLTQENLVYEWIMWPALLLMALYLGLFGGAAFSVATWVSRRRGWSVVWTLPVIWSLFEWVRTQGDLGFPWGTFGYAWWAAPVMFQSVDLWGIFGLSLVTLGVAVRLAWPSRRRLAEAAAVLALLAAYGGLRLAEAPPEETLDVAVIQPNWGASEKWDPENRGRVFRRYLEQTADVVPDTAGLVVWPETATPFRLLAAPSHVAAIQRWVDRHDTPLITGTVHHETLGETTTFYNAAVRFVPGEPEAHATYYKRYLVPFSEWLPWKWLRIMEINFGQADFTPGADASPLRVGAHAGGILICIEAILPRYARASVAAGADFFVNITNDVWFGDGPAPRHHADMARFRAAEMRRPIVRSANTGISMLVDRTGCVTRSLGTFRQGVLRGEIRPERTRTLYARLGDWSVLVSTLGLAAAFGRSARARRRLPPVA